MGSGIDDFFGRATVREVHVCAGISETKLQHSHPGNLKPIAQSVHFRRDVAEVFGEKWEPPEGFPQFFKNIVLGAVYPSPIHCGGFAGRNLPGLLKPAEVVQADVIAIPRGPT